MIRFSVVSVPMALAVLASDPAQMQRTGQILLTAQLGQEYGFADMDGKIIQPVALADA